MTQYIQLGTAYRRIGKLHSKSLKQIFFWIPRIEITRKQQIGTVSMVHHTVGIMTQRLRHFHAIFSRQLLHAPARKMTDKHIECIAHNQFARYMKNVARRSEFSFGWWRYPQCMDSERTKAGRLIKQGNIDSTSIERMGYDILITQPAQFGSLRQIAEHAVVFDLD